MRLLAALLLLVVVAQAEDDPPPDTSLGKEVEKYLEEAEPQASGTPWSPVAIWSLGDGVFAGRSAQPSVSSSE